MSTILQKFQNRKLLAAIAIIIIVGGYYGYGRVTSAPASTRYVLAQVSKGTLITSVNGTGQVSSSNQLDIKSNVAGDALEVPAVNGQSVKAGDLLVKLDDSDAQKAVRDARSNLESSQLALQKLQQPADNLSVLQAENALVQSQQSKQQAEDDLAKSYDDGFNSVANAFLDLPGIMTGLQDTLYGTSFNTAQININYYSDTVKMYDPEVIQYRDDVDASYQKARKEYDQNFIDYKAASRQSDTATIESLVSETYETTKSMADTVKNANNLIQFYEDRLAEHNLKPSPTADAQLTTLNTYTSKTNTYLSDLLAIKTTINNDKDSITNADRTIAEKTESLAKLKAGADSLDVQTQKLAITQKANALQDAEDKLADYSVKAPFDGVVATVNVKKGDSVSASTAIATLITTQKIATISVNEVDAVKIKAGQKATLTFDAIPDLSISGQVAEIDTIGTVTQGVVNYSVKISFDTQDDRVKPGMSASVAVITDIKQDVLMVSNSALKTSGNSSYVETLDSSVAANQSGNQGVASQTPPKQQTVEIGSANDSSTEILSGLNEGDWIVTRTIAPSSTGTSAASGSTQQRNGGIGGMLGGGGGGGVRIMGGGR